MECLDDRSRLRSRKSLVERQSSVAAVPDTLQRAHELWATREVEHDETGRHGR